MQRWISFLDREIAEEFIEFTLGALIFFSVDRRLLFVGDVGPNRSKLGIQHEPFFQARFGVSLDGVGGHSGSQTPQ